MGHFQPKHRTDMKLVDQEVTTKRPTRDFYHPSSAGRACLITCLGPPLLSMFDLLPRLDNVTYKADCFDVHVRWDVVCVFHVLHHDEMTKFQEVVIIRQLQI